MLEWDLYRFLIHDEESARRILGLLDFCRSVEPSYVTQLLIKYESHGEAANSPGGVIAALREVSRNEGPNDWLCS